MDFEGEKHFDWFGFPVPHSKAFHPLGSGIGSSSKIEKKCLGMKYLKTTLIFESHLTAWQIYGVDMIDMVVWQVVSTPVHCVLQFDLSRLPATKRGRLLSFSSALLSRAAVFFTGKICIILVI